MRVIVDEVAWSDLDKIGSWIAEDNPEAAWLALEKIERVIKQLGQFPGLSRVGRAREHGKPLLPAHPTSLCSSFGKIRTPWLSRASFTVRETDSSVFVSSIEMIC
jgi:plasmid stabilization system protein ParE